jgi:hypothetical protein
MDMLANLFIMVAVGESDIESTSRRTAGAAAMSAGVPGEHHRHGDKDKGSYGGGEEVSTD